MVVVGEGDLERKKYLQKDRGEGSRGAGQRGSALVGDRRWWVKEKMSAGIKVFVWGIQS